jgi:hypothetical protein
MKHDDGYEVIGGNGPEPEYDLKHQTRVMPNGRVYRIPPSGKRIIYLVKDCGLLLFDVDVFRRIPGFWEVHMSDGNPIANAQWKKENVFRFPRWRRFMQASSYLDRF